MQILHTEKEAAAILGLTEEGLRPWRTGAKLPPNRTPLVEGFHWYKIGRPVRYDLNRFRQWLTEPKAVHQRRIDQYFESLASDTPVEGVRSPGRPRKEVATK
jgi:hypothetical protein